jgi:DNA-binding LacI/PurR family transcriptional regulator
VASSTNIAWSHRFSAPTTALLSRSERPTAIACATDQLALGVPMAARDHNLSVGHDVAITGFDDSSLAQVGRDGIMSVHQPSAKVADTLVDPAPRHVLLQPELVVRSSTSGRAS